MKQDIHPQYFEKATVKCSCGATHTLGSTKEKMAVEICSKCHPFYTGKEKLVDTAGRVERFKSRQKTAETKKTTVKPKKTTPKKKVQEKNILTPKKKTPRRNSGQAAKKAAPKKKTEK